MTGPIARRDARRNRYPPLTQLPPRPPVHGARGLSLKSTCRCRAGGVRSVRGQDPALHVRRFGARPHDPWAHPTRHRQRARGECHADLQRAEAAARHHRRQRQRPRAQARGCRLHQLPQGLRGSRAAHGVQAHGRRAEGDGPLLRPH